MTFFHWEWTPEESATHYAKISSWNATIVAFMVALTQYAVSQWIWFGGRKKTNRPPHYAPVYLVSLMVFGYIWDTMFNYYLAGRIAPFGTQIATPVVVLAGAPLNLLFCWVWTKIFPAEKKNDDDVEEEEILAKVEGGAAPKEQENQSNAQIEEGTPATKKPSIAYINNIKIYLTVLVILHHCATGVSGITSHFLNIYPDQVSYWYKVVAVMLTVNQAFFMNLFFFFSGYFVPRSFDKKGAYVFIMERAKRLGIPFVVYIFLLGPFCRRIWLLAFYKGSAEVPFSTFFEDGPVWFLNQLIVLGIAYSFLCGKGWSPKIACPSLLGFLGIATVVGLLTTLLSMAFPEEGVLMVPDFWGHYLGYVVYFFGGALAQRNNWMESIKAMRRAPIYVLTVICFGLVVFENFYEIPLKWPLWATTLYNGITTDGSWCTVVFSLAVTVFFMDFLDKTYFFTDFFAKSMYTAYIIHMPIGISLAVASLIALYEATGHMVWTEVEGLGEIYVIMGANYLFAGFVFVAVVTNIITWPLAYGIRSIPGFSQVL